MLYKKDEGNYFRYTQLMVPTKCDGQVLMELHPYGYLQPLLESPIKNCTGAYFYNESASLKGIYAYHLPLNDQGCFLDFRIYSSIMNDWIDCNKVAGDPSDQNLHRFNTRPLYLEEDFGITRNCVFSQITFLYQEYSTHTHPIHKSLILPVLRYENCI